MKVKVNSLEEFKIVTELYREPWIRNSRDMRIPSNELVYEKVNEKFKNKNMKYVVIKIEENEKQWECCYYNSKNFNIEFDELIYKTINYPKAKSFFPVNL